MRPDESDVGISDSLQCAVECLARAKWIEGRAFVSPERVELSWTECGRSKLRKLGPHLKPFEPFTPGKGKLRRLFSYFRLRFVFAIHSPELKAHRLSYAQEIALIVCLASEAKSFRERGEV